MLALPDGRKKDISRFSTIVRDLHHYLSYRMLACDGGEDYGLDDYGEIVAQVCLYHRGKMPIKDRDDAFREEASRIEIEDPVSEKLMVNGKSIRARLLASLLRIIDACDVQEERTVDEGHVVWRRALTESEIDAERERMERLYGIIKERVKQNNELFRCLAAIRKRTQEYTSKVKKLTNFCRNFYMNQDASDNIMEIYEEYKVCLKDLQNKLRKTINQIWAPDIASGFDPASLLLLEAWAESASRVIFKADQDVHFLKHGQVRQVAFVPCEDFGENEKYKFKIKIWPNEQHIKPWLEMIKTEIECELDKVKGNLEPVEICNPEIENPKA